MTINLERSDVVTLIETGEISRDGVTIKMQESRREAVAARTWDRAHPELTDGTFTHKRRWQPARELDRPGENLDI